MCVGREGLWKSQALMNEVMERGAELRSGERHRPAVRQMGVFLGQLEMGDRLKQSSIYSVSFERTTGCKNRVTSRNIYFVFIENEQEFINVVIFLTFFCY